MIITCPFCDKKFEIDRSLIPKNGRLLQCGACDRKWHFNLSDENNEDQNTKEEFNISDSETNEVVEENNSTEKTNNQEIKESISVPIYNQQSIELNNEDNKVINNEIKKIRYINYFFVMAISFVALVIILDTFKSPISIKFPGINIMLNNLYESVKDIFLFIKDLI